MTPTGRSVDLSTLYHELAAYGPVSSTLSKLVRPTIQAKKGHVFVWCDWSAIEARVNPWLAMESNSHVEPGFEQVLKLFHEGADPYIANAKDIFEVDEIDPKTAEGGKMRQSGKIAVLSLGFLGSIGALKAMARGYGLRMSDEEAFRIVGKWGLSGWRGRNTWAKTFGDRTWDAFQSAIHSPGTVFKAGRLEFTFEKNLLGGSVLTWLPSGRPLVYPQIREGLQPVGKDDEEKEYAITYRHGHGRARMWAGKVIQGPTQACAADILREKLVELDQYDNVVMHTHDEILLEVPSAEGEMWAERLCDLMCELPPWADDTLPLAAEPETGWYYSKAG